MDNFPILIAAIASIVTIVIGVLTIVRMHPNVQDIRKIWGITSGIVVLILLGTLFISAITSNLAKPSTDNISQTPTEAPIGITATLSSVPTATSITTQSPILNPSPNTVLYSTNSFNGWAGSSDWKISNGTLLNDGSFSQIQPTAPTIVAPTQLSVANYAVEASMMEQGCNTGEQWSFGITVRGDASTGSWQGYKVAITNRNLLLVATADNADLDEHLNDVAFNPGSSFHTYRIELRDNTIKVFADNYLRLTIVNNKYLSGGQVGLWSAYCQLTINSFKVLAL